MELERIALEDDYFVTRKLYPNVDFYSGIIFRALGLPPAMFTPIFAVARTVGWVAHWNEMIADPETRIFRPRQLYQGPTERPVAPISRAPTASAAWSADAAANERGKAHPCRRRLCIGRRLGCNRLAYPSPLLYPTGVAVIAAVSGHP